MEWNEFFFVTAAFWPDTQENAACVRSHMQQAANTRLLSDTHAD